MADARSTNPPGRERPSPWMPAAEVVQLVPSCRPGKRLHLSTVVRWVRGGRLRGKKIGRWWYVWRADVLEMLSGPGPVVADPAAEAAYVRDALERHGLGAYCS